MVLYTIIGLIALVIYTLYFHWTTGEDVDLFIALGFTIAAGAWPFTLPIFGTAAITVAIFNYFNEK